MVALLRSDVVVPAMRYINVGVGSLPTAQMVGALLSIHVRVGALVNLLSIQVLVGAVQSIHILVGILLRINV